MNFISGINTTASALSAEKLRMDVVSQNIANAHTTRGPNGQPYVRKVVSFESYLEPGQKDLSCGQSVRVSSVTNDPSPGESIHDPSHPDADADGNVRMPNVNLAFEMVDLMTASRAYEANLAVVRNAKQMAMKALSIGR
jgi:flagellar basal-body rod protein FlgC